MNRLLIALVIFGVNAYTLSVHAATLSAVKGMVLANVGNGYQPAHENQHLKIGDSIIANPGASAQVVCEDGTAVNVEPGAVVTVADCAEMAAAAQGGLGATAGISTTGLVVGGLAAAGAAGVATAVSNRSDRTDRPVSP